MNPQSVPKDLYLFQAIGDGAPIIPGAEPMSLDYREGELQDAIFSFEVEQLSQRDSFTLAMMTPALDRPLEVKAKRSGGALIFFAKCEGDRDWQNWKRLRAMELRMLNVAHGRSGFLRTIRPDFGKSRGGLIYLFWQEWKALLSLKNGYVEGDVLKLEVEVTIK